MIRTAKALAVLGALTMIEGAAAATHGAGQYPNYYAARRALDRGDCEAGVGYLRAYLRNHPTIRDEHPDHYLEVTFVMESCTSKLEVRGIGDESDALAPLPDHPPLED